MAQIKPPVRSLEDIDDNLQGRNPDEETTTTTQTDDSQPKRTFYRSPSEEEEQNKPAESEKPEDDEDPLEAAEDELEPKPEPEEHLEEPVSTTQRPDMGEQKVAEDTLDELASEETSEEELRKSPQQSQDLHIPNLKQNPNPTSDHSFASRYADRPKNSSKLPLVFLAIIGIGVLGTSVYLLKGQLRTFKNVLGINAVVPSPSPPASPSPSPSPTPTPIPDRSKFKVRVLNGTTKIGLAATVLDKLKGLGYQSDKAANATNSAFPQTVVRTKENSDGLSDQLIKDLSQDYSASSAGNLKDSDIVDGEVILGAK